MKDEHAQIVDWILTIIAVVLAGIVAGLPQETVARSDRRANIADIRALETNAKLLDATKSLPLEVQKQIGLKKDSPELDRLQVIDELVDQLEPDSMSPDLFLIGASIAVVLESDVDALELLDEWAKYPKKVQRYRLVGASLKNLAERKGATNIPVLVSDLQSLGASPWLTEKLRARHYRNSGDIVASEESEAFAGQLAATFVQRMVSLLALGSVLGMLGMLLLVAWPLLRRWLEKLGSAGLDGSTSPFLVAKTQRVMAVWFIAYVGIAFSFPSFFEIFGVSGASQPLAMVFQALMHGAVALIVMQKWGRPLYDLTPLTVPLGMRMSKEPYGTLKFVGWVCAGFSVGLVVVAMGTYLTGLISGEVVQSQPIFEVFAQQDSIAMRLAIGVSAVVLAPIFEEIIFRGYLYRNLRDTIGVGPATLASGFLFGCAHLQLDVILPLTALGCVLGFLYERTGSLFVPMAVHAVWNTGQLVVLMVLVQG